MTNYRVSPALRIVIVMIFLVLTAIAGTVQAAVTKLKSGDTLPGTKWKVEFDAPVTLEFDDQTKPNDTVGTLIETTDRLDSKETMITFTQTEKPTMNSEVCGGLRLIFQAKVTNNTINKESWFGYLLELIDDAPVAEDPPHVVHPAWPHFHPNAKASKATFKPWDQFATPNDPTKDLFIHDNGQTLVAPGQAFEVSNLLIHERHFADVLRKFRLREKPVPALDPV